MSFDLNELEEFLHDDSDGQRLANFFKSKQRTAQPKRLFSRVKIPHISFNGSFVKPLVRPLPTACESLKENNVIENDNRSAEEFKNTDVGNRPPKIVVTQPPPNDLVQPLTEPQQKISSIANRLSIASRIGRSSGNNSPSDRLRRISFQRRSQNIGRRSLLKEFETQSNDSSKSNSSSFNPQICSTPSGFQILSQANAPRATSKAPSILNRNQDSQLCEMLENALKNTLQNVNKPPNTTNNKTLSPHSCPATPTSVREKTYTLQRGAISGQVILTPTSSGILEKTVETSPSNATQLRMSLNGNAQLSPRCATLTLQNRSIGKGSVTKTTPRLQINKDLSYLGATQVNTPTKEADNSILPDVEIPETQEAGMKETESLVVSLHSNGSPVVVIPVHQTFNKSTKSVENNKRTPERRNNSASQHQNTAQMLHEILTEDENDDEIHKTVRNRTAVSEKTVQNSFVPLNLAPNDSRATRSRRVRKRSTVKRGKDHNVSETYDTATDEDQNDCVLNLRNRNIHSNRNTSRRHLKNKKLPLNKAPQNPINGEKFAKELARLSNYEIMDLRKRNSMGKIFPICGRRSEKFDERLHAEEQRIKLEDEIQSEILRRNLIGNDEYLPTLQAGSSTSIIVQVPDDFKDSEDEIEREVAQIVGHSNNVFRDEHLPTLQAERNANIILQVPHDFNDPEDENRREVAQIIGQSNEVCVATQCDLISSVLHDKSSDRVSFVTHKNQHGKKLMPEMSQELRKYLDVTQKVKKTSKKSKKSPSKHKRSLYTKGDSETEDGPNNTASPEKISKVIDTSIECVRSPPYGIQTRLSRSLQNIVSPPQQYVQSLRPSVCEANVEHNNNDDIIEILPPPTLFSDICSTDEQMEPLRVYMTTPVTHLETDRQSRCVEKASDVNTTAHNTTKAKATIVDDGELPSTSRAIPHRSSDDHIFKKPQVPSRRYKKKKNSVTKATPEVEASPEEPLMLRRSKRGHIPLQHKYSYSQNAENPSMSLFQILYQKQMEISLKRSQKSREKKSLLMTANSQDFGESNMRNKRSRSEVNDKNTQELNTPQEKPEAQARNDKRRKKVDRSTPLRDDFNRLQMCTGFVTSTPMSNIGGNELETIIETDYNDVDERGDNDVVASTKATKERNKPTKTQSKINKKTKENPKKTKTKNDHNEKTTSSEHSLRGIDKMTANQLESIFDQLKENRSGNNTEAEMAATEPQQKQQMEANASKQRKLRVRLKRERNALMTENSIVSSSNEETGNQPQQYATKADIGAWFQGVCDLQTKEGGNDHLTNLHISSADKLIFTSLDGIDYAFYDTEQQASLGYMRFKPKQFRPSKRAKTYELQFIVMSGKFLIKTCNGKNSTNECATLVFGDMATIQKGTRYSIENVSDAISILMVIKK